MQKKLLIASALVASIFGVFGARSAFADRVTELNPYPRMFPTKDRFVH